MKKGTQLLEIYALEIQMYTAQKNNKKLKVSDRLDLSELSGLCRPAALCIQLYASLSHVGM